MCRKAHKCKIILTYRLSKYSVMWKWVGGGCTCNKIKTEHDWQQSAFKLTVLHELDKQMLLLTKTYLSSWTQPVWRWNQSFYSSTTQCIKFKLNNLQFTYTSQILNAWYFVHLLNWIINCNVVKWRQLFIVKNAI